VRGKPIGELVAASGVILGLVFVAFEIRQNTDAMQSGTIQALSEQSFDYAMRLSEDHEFLRIQARLTEPGVTRADLSPVESRIQELKYAAGLRIIENRYRQYQFGTVTEASLSQVGGGSRGYYGGHLFQDWWASRDQTLYFAADFIEFFERQYPPVN
jgi:hypothetical protein